MSGAHWRALPYIAYSACSPVTGSGGFFSTLGSGADEQPAKKSAARKNEAASAHAGRLPRNLRNLAACHAILMYFQCSHKQRKSFAVAMKRGAVAFDTRKD